jgi:hypothetical protein|tara:strand:+ start:179 stop:448 length:270 start_codon:yes stop_codon:yes gene_type:complete
MTTSKLAGKEEDLMIIRHRSLHQLISCSTLAQFQLMTGEGIKVKSRNQTWQGLLRFLIVLLKNTIKDRTLIILTMPIKAVSSMVSLLSH